VPLDAERTLILLVEDDVLQRIAAHDLLVEAGHDVAEASSAVDALGWLLGRPDVAAIITDIDMPGPLDGADLVRILAAIAPQTPIIVISATSNAPAGVFRHLPKPYFPGDLLDAVEAALIACKAPDADRRREDWRP